MGLDQYAYIRETHEKFEDVELAFVWRKHAKLQEWMENLYIERTGQPSENLNCGELPLCHDDMVTLKGLIEGNNLPSCPGGFFYGHQFEDETAKEYIDQDREFCLWAMKQMQKGKAVYYSCWW